MSEEEKPIITSCRDCIFATWDDNTQTGCKFDRIDKFEMNGAEIVGQDDGEKRYFLIVGRFCNTCRNKDWGKNNPRRKWKSIVEETIKVRVDIIIKADDNNSLQEIMDTVDSAYEQTIKPKLVVIAYNGQSAIEIVGKMKNENRGPWRLEKLPWQEAVKFCRSSYYAVFNSGYIIPPDFIETINKALNEDMTRFVVLQPDADDNGLVVQQCGVSLDKIYEMAEETQTWHMVKDFTDL